MTTALEHEVSKVIEKFKADMEKALQKFSSFALLLKRNSAVSQTIESRIHSIISEYATAKYKFCLNLKELYFKENKPHTLDLREAIKSKEHELKLFLADISKRGLQIYHDIFDQLVGVDPVLLNDLLSMIEVSFETLQQEFKQMALDAKTSESNFRQLVITALAKVVADVEDQQKSWP